MCNVFISSNYEVYNCWVTYNLVVSQISLFVLHEYIYLALIFIEVILTMCL